MHEDRELRLVHRIESFSDLVMGFSLALLGLTLVIPPHATNLIRHPSWLLEYFWTFAYIASVWFNHQRLFQRYFVPSRPSIVVNFILLSMLGLVVYFVQVFSHMHDDQDKAAAFFGYFAAFGISLIAIGTLYAIGTKTRWDELSTDDRKVGLRRSVRPICVGLALTGGVIVEYLVTSSLTMESIERLAFVIVFAMIFIRIVLHFVEPRVGAPTNRAENPA